MVFLPTPFIKKVIFFVVHFLGTLIKRLSALCNNFWGLLVLPLVCVLLLLPGPCSDNDYSFGVHWRFCLVCCGVTSCLACLALGPFPYAIHAETLHGTSHPCGLHRALCAASSGVPFYTGLSSSSSGWRGMFQCTLCAQAGVALCVTPCGQDQSLTDSPQVFTFKYALFCFW